MARQGRSKLKQSPCIWSLEALLQRPISQAEVDRLVKKGYLIEGTDNYTLPISHQYLHEGGNFHAEEPSPHLSEPVLKDQFKDFIWGVAWRKQDNAVIQNILLIAALLQLDLDEMPPELVAIMRRLTGSDPIPGKG